MLTKAGIGFRFVCRGRSSKDLQAISAVVDRRRTSVSVHRGVRGGVEAMGTSRLEAKRILQVGGPIGVLQDISSGERNLCVSVRASTYVWKWKAELT